VSEPTGPVLLRFDHASLAYGRARVVEDVHGSVHGGEAVALIGPNGAGKSTLLRAVLGLVDALHAEYARDGVRVNAIMPGTIDTPGNRAAQPDADRSGWTQPAAIGRVILFLCGDEGAAISGAQIPV